MAKRHKKAKSRGPRRQTTLDLKTYLPTSRFKTGDLNVDGLPSPGLFVSRVKEVQRLIKNIQDWRGTVIEGGAGVGKTSYYMMAEEVLRQAFGDEMSFSSVGTFGANPSELVRLAADGWGVQINHGKPLEMIRGLEQKLDGKKKYVLFVDEGMDFDSLSKPARTQAAIILRTLINCRNKKTGRKLCVVVLAGLLGTLEKIGDTSPTLKRRFDCVKLAPLDAKETEAYVKTYLEPAGVDPRLISSKAAQEIHTQTNGIPGDINLKLLKILEHLPQKGPLPMVDDVFVKLALGIETVTGDPEYDSLSDHQKKILKKLAEFPDGALPSELAEALNKEHPEMKITRTSLSTTLKTRLLSGGWVDRKAEGDTYRYSLSSKAKSAMANA